MAFTVQSHLVNIPLQALPIAAAALDRNGVIVAANHQFVRLSGQPGASSSGRRLADIVSKPNRPVVEAALSGLTLPEGGNALCSFRALRATPPSLRLAIDVARLGPESVAPYLACLQEIPKQPRAASLATRRMAARRPHDGGVRSGRSTSPRKVERWSPFLMTLSHELRGPLTAIQNWSHVAESGVLPPEKVARALTVIGRNAASLSSLIEEMFDLSRRSVGALVLNRQVLDLNPLVRHVVESALPAARRRNVILSSRTPPGAIFVNADPVRLEQIVRNLVENAIKFTPSNGRVHVQTAIDQGAAELVVTDTGSGIAADLLPFVFEPFRQEVATVRPSERGLGLGLAIVRDLTELHDGEVRAMSEGPGHGSSFVVRLPLADSIAPDRRINTTVRRIELLNPTRRARQAPR